jgi:hypothetical protein
MKNGLCTKNYPKYEELLNLPIGTKKGLFEITHEGAWIEIIRRVT